MSRNAKNLQFIELNLMSIAKTDVGTKIKIKKMPLDMIM